MERIEKCKLAIKKGFTYCKTSGDITSPTGKVCVKKSMNGYIMLTVRDEKSFAYYLYGHQFAWFVVNNETVPCLDHVNRNRTDNRIINLRSVTPSQNGMNMSNTKGYYFCKRSKKYIAIIMIDYKKKQLGSFNTPEEAISCYLENKNKYHIINKK